MPAAFDKALGLISMTDARRGSFTVLAVALVAVAASILAAWGASEAEDASRRDLYRNEVGDLRLAIERRLGNLHELLRGAQGLFAASRSVERAEWQEFVGCQRIGERCPEVYSFHYVAFVGAANRAAFLATTRSDGAPDFDIRPPGTRPEMLIAKYAEPQPRNAALLGYDLCTDSLARVMHERTRDTGEPAMSALKRFPSDPDGRPSVSIALPVYANGQPHTTIEERRASWIGAVVIAVRIGDLLRPLIAGEASGWQVCLFDGPSTSPDQTLFAQGPAVMDPAETTRSLQEVTDRMRGVLDSARDAILTMNEQGVVESMNGAASRIFGYAPGEVVGGPMTRLIPETWRDAHTKGIEQYLRTGEGRIVGRTTEVEGLRKDGSTVPIEVAISEMRLGGRRLFTGILRDITERKANERAIQETNRKLAATLDELSRTQHATVQQERLRAIGTMASGIAHDFNNSLAAILGFAELLLVRPELRSDPEALQRHLELIRTAARDASAVVGRLKEFYRHRDEAEVMHPVSMNALVEGALSLTRPRWKDMAQAKGIDIQVRADLAPELPEVPGNEVELREVLINLILNSLDAMPKGGSIAIATRSDGRRVVVEVEDTGAGMTEEVRRRCMEPFYTTKGPQGTGLGLSVAYGVLQRHQGTLDVESAPGEGTRVRMTIPFRSGATPLPERLPRAETFGPLRVLVVEDEPLVQEVIAGYLQAAGHEVVTASNGREGLERFHAGRFDLVITDQGMPEMTGTQLAAAVKQVAPEKPILLLTGWGEQLKAADERPPGIDLILSKPVGLSALLDAVASLVAGARRQA